MMEYSVNYYITLLHNTFLTQIDIPADYVNNTYIISTMYDYKWIISSLSHTPGWITIIKNIQNYD
jgi:hypothetical protein